MALYITELYGALNRGRMPLTGQPIAAYSISSLSTAAFPSAGVSMIRVSADAASLLNVISTSTGTALTSTNAFRIPANVAPEFFAVSTSMRIQCAST